MTENQKDMFDIKYFLPKIAPFTKYLKDAVHPERPKKQLNI
jgi:hypothetical protein